MNREEESIIIPIPTASHPTGIVEPEFNTVSRCHKVSCIMDIGLIVQCHIDVDDDLDALACHSRAAVGHRGKELEAVCRITCQSLGLGVIKVQCILPKLRPPGVRC